MNTDMQEYADIQEYLDEIRRQACSECLAKPAGGPPCAPLGSPCAVELSLGRLLEAAHAAAGLPVAVLVENMRREATRCEVEGCHCPSDEVLAAIVRAIATVDHRL